MNRQMRRMLEKKGGIDMNSPEIKNLVEMGGGKLFTQLMKDKTTRKVMNLIKKNKNEEQEMVCSSCHDTIVLKGVLSQCPNCKEWVINESLVNDEEVLNKLKEIIEMLNKN